MPRTFLRMWSTLLDWVFHWTLLWLAFELGKRWNEKDVAASIAALTEKQSRRRSQEIMETPLRVGRVSGISADDQDRRSPRGSPTMDGSPTDNKAKRRLSRPVSSVFAPNESPAELRPLIMVDMVDLETRKADFRFLRVRHRDSLVHRMT